VWNCPADSASSVWAMYQSHILRQAALPCFYNVPGALQRQSSSKTPAPPWQPWAAVCCVSTDLQVFRVWAHPYRDEPGNLIATGQAQGLHTRRRKGTRQKELTEGRGMHDNDRAGWPAANECKEIKQGRSGLNNKEESRQACVWFLGSGLMRRFERFISTSLCRNGRHGAYVGVPDSSQSCCVDKGLLDEVGMTPAKPLVSIETARGNPSTVGLFQTKQPLQPCSRIAVRGRPSVAWTQPLGGSPLTSPMP
jgi:hypothetical protein